MKPDIFEMLRNFLRYLEKNRENPETYLGDVSWYLYLGLDQCCYGYIINRAFRSGAFDSSAFVKVVLTQLQNGGRFT